MDPRRFDRYVTTLARNWPRRRLLFILPGLVAASLAAPEPALACKKVGRRCARNDECCNGSRCKNEKCRCKSGFQNCDGLCFDLEADAANCGACAAACNADEVCCSGTCADLDVGREHCGACENACPVNQVCFEGSCFPCPPGNAFCGDVCCPPFESCCNGVCVDDVSFNPDHCGECNNRCPFMCTRPDDGPLVCQPRCCSSGECVADVLSDRDNCGGCGIECDADENCCDGECGGTCGNRFCACDETCCDDTCADLGDDDDHCGDCGVACVPGQVCQEGRCRDTGPN